MAVRAAETRSRSEQYASSCTYYCFRDIARREHTPLFYHYHQWIVKCQNATKTTSLAQACLNWGRRALICGCALRWMIEARRRWYSRSCDFRHHAYINNFNMRYGCRASSLLLPLQNYAEPHSLYDLDFTGILLFSDLRQQDYAWCFSAIFIAVTA